MARHPDGVNLRRWWAIPEWAILAARALLVRAKNRRIALDLGGHFRAI